MSSHFVTPPIPMAEKEAALAAFPSDAPTIFDKIINKEIPDMVFFEDDSLPWLNPGQEVETIKLEYGRDKGNFRWNGEMRRHHKVLAFRDTNPQASKHILIIPKVKDGLIGLFKAEERHTKILGQLLYAAKLIATHEGLDDGFRIVINDGPNGCQSVYHLHIHLLGGRQMNWPPG